MTLNIKASRLSIAAVGLSAFLPGCSGGTSVSTPHFAPTPAPASKSVTTPTPIPTSTSDALRVACVGDSITRGAGTSKPTTDSYPSVLGRFLGSNYQVKNLGISGSSLLNKGALAYQRTTAYTQALSFKPNILIVALGTNDASNGFNSATRTQFQKDYKALIAAFKAANSAVKIYPCLPPPRYASRNDVLSEEVLPLIRTVARDEGLKLIDFNTPMSNHAELFVDGIHPNNEGARIIASTVYGALTGQQPPA